MFSNVLLDRDAKSTFCGSTIFVDRIKLENHCSWTQTVGGTGCDFKRYQEEERLKTNELQIRN